MVAFWTLGRWKYNTFAAQRTQNYDVMTSANCAYLQLPGKETGGTTPTNEWDNFISYNKADAMAKAQIFNTFVVDYPDWNDNDVTGIKEIDDNKTTEPSSIVFWYLILVSYQILFLIFIFKIITFVLFSTFNYSYYASVTESIKPLGITYSFVPFYILTIFRKCYNRF